MHARPDWLSNLQPQPDASLARARYAGMAQRYDASCRHIEPLRIRAIRELGIRNGETVIDVACGTGTTTEVLARAVGSAGRVVGIEQSPEMAALARERLRRAGLTQAVVEVASVQQAVLREQADAFLFSFTHDVLQQPDAVAALLRMAKPGARYALLGMRSLPWGWGWPVNLFVLWRARRYLTTYHGLAAPWSRLAAASREFRFVGTWHAGTTYLALGTFKPVGEDS